MPIGTSTGQAFESELEAEISLSPITIENEAPSNDYLLDPVDPNGPFDDSPTDLQRLREGPNIYEDLKRREQEMERELAVPKSDEELMPKPQSISDIPPELPRITVTPKPREDEGFQGYYGKRLQKAFERLTGTGGEERYQTWPEKLVRTIGDAMTLPRRVIQEGEDPMSAENIGRAAELAGTLVLGPMPLARKVIDGTLGSIAGVSAKTVNKEALQEAMSLDRKGLTTEEIWRKTGFYKGLEGKWRFELPSEKAKFQIGLEALDNAGELAFRMKSENTYYDDLGKILDFKELFDAYPDLKNVQVIFKNIGERTLGTVLTHPDNRTEIIINPFAIANSTENIMNVLLHEVQHIIQRKEGFNPGSNPQSRLSSAFDFLADRYIQAESKGNRDEMNRLSLIYQGLLSDEKKTGGALYRRTPGEVEARIVELRREWTAAQKQMESPHGTTKRGGEEGWVPSPLPFPQERRSVDALKE